MKFLLTMLLLLGAYTSPAYAKYVCYDTFNDKPLSEDFCVDQRSFQSTYRAAVYESLASQHTSQERMRLRVAQSAYLSLMNYIDDRALLRIEQLARRDSKPDLYLDVVEEWLVDQYQRQTIGLPADIRKRVTDKSISYMLSSLDDQYAHYPAYSEHQHFFDGVEECECVRPVTELGDGILYLQLRYYANITHRLVEKWLTPYFENTDVLPKGLILDVRGNPGGLIHGGTRTASLFLSDAKVLKLSDTWGEKLYKTAIEDITHGVDIALLANGDSASATEAMMLALRENDRVVIFGSTSFGKSRIQAPKYLPNGERLIFTTGRYLSPSGLDIHGKGIEPDFEVSDNAPGCTLPNGERADAVICAAVTHLSNGD